jgi:hypothetical protein
MANSNGWGDGSVNNNIGWGQGANNSTGWGKSHLNSWSGATDIDGGNPPVNSVAPALSGTAQEGQTLTCSTGTWSGSPTYTYQWKRDGNDITSATNSTYTLVTADVGTSIKCTVTATNFTGSATADSNTVTPTSSVDADAQAFITAASITDPTQQSAINTLVLDLKGYNIWTKMKALYPFVGGTASQHKWNLKDPRDLDAAFRLVFSGGVTHSSNGVQFGGVNGWAETYLNANTAFTTNDSFHGSIYSRTNSNIDGCDYGGVNASARTELWLRSSTDNLVTSAHLNRITTPNSNSTGYYVSTRSNSTTFKVFKNNSQLGSTYTGANGARLDVTMPIGAYKIGTTPLYFSNKQYAFASIGDGLTDTEAANFYTAVQAFQTTLGRQV